jgi:hypothetical protein
VQATQVLLGQERLAQSPFRLQGCPAACGPAQMLSLVSAFVSVGTQDSPDAQPSLLPLPTPAQASPIALTAAQTPRLQYKPDAHGFVLELLQASPTARSAVNFDATQPKPLAQGSLDEP